MAAGKRLAGVCQAQEPLQRRHGGDCVEVAALPDAIALRDSKHPDGPALVVTPAAWQAFVTAVRSDAFPT